MMTKTHLAVTIARDEHSGTLRMACGCTISTVTKSSEDPNDVDCSVCLRSKTFKHYAAGWKAAQEHMKARVMSVFGFTA